MVEIPAWMLLVLGAGVASIVILLAVGLFAVIDRNVDLEGK